METVTRSPSTPGALPDQTPLGALDRCDRCGAQAYIRVSLPSGMSLLFCGHHGNGHRPALAVAGAAFHDETDKLTVKRESGFNG